MASRSYEKTKASTYKYFAKCERIQFFLNPDKPDDKIIMDYLANNTDGMSRQAQIKQMVLKYIKMQEAFKGI